MRPILIAGFAAEAATLLIPLLLGRPYELRVVLSGAGGLLITLLVVGLMRAGYVKIAAWTLVVLLWAMFSTVSAVGAGVFGPAFAGGQLVVIIISGLLLSARAGVLFAGLGIVAGFFLAVGQSAGIAGQGRILEPLPSWLISASLFSVVAAVQALSARIIRESRNREAQALAAHKAGEQERDSLIQELRRKNLELERFTYTVSHDLRSPLVTIRSFAGFIRESVQRGAYDRITEDLQYVDRAAKKMTSLLDELLDLSRIGRIAEPPEMCTIESLLQEALALTAGGILERGVSVRLDGLPGIVLGERARLVEVFQNLLDNAVKFMGQQSKPEIQIRSSADDSGVSVELQDNGQGIDPRYLHRIFDLFEQLEPTSEGVGMGLAIVKRIVEIHGGAIVVHSDGPGQGSTFRVSFPNTIIQTK